MRFFLLKDVVSLMNVYLLVFSVSYWLGCLQHAFYCPFSCWFWLYLSWHLKWGIKVWLYVENTQFDLNCNGIVIYPYLGKQNWLHVTEVIADLTFQLIIYMRTASCFSHAGFLHLHYSNSLLRTPWKWTVKYLTSFVPLKR